MGMLNEGIAVGLPGVASTLDDGLGGMSAPGIASVSTSGARFRAANGIDVNGGTASRATLDDVVASIAHMEARLDAQIRRQTDRGVLLTKTGVHR